MVHGAKPMNSLPQKVMKLTYRTRYKKAARTKMPERLAPI